MGAGKHSLIASRYPALADRGSGAGKPTIHDAATAAVEHKGGGAAVDPAVAAQAREQVGTVRQAEGMANTLNWNNQAPGLTSTEFGRWLLPPRYSEIVAGGLQPRPPDRRHVTPALVPGMQPRATWQVADDGRVLVPVVSEPDLRSWPSFHERAAQLAVLASRSRG